MNKELESYENMKAKGLETYQELVKWMTVVLEEGAKFYSKGNQAAGRRARKAADRVAKLKIQWKKEMLQ